jgi:DNA-binding NarL/FixJ family response regulator
VTIEGDDAVTESGVGTKTEAQFTSSTNSSRLSTTTIRVLIAEDHTALRYTLRSVLKGYADIEIVGEAIDGEEAVLKAQALQPSIVLMDINMPKLDGIAATKRIKARSNGITVLGLSVHGEGDAINAMLEAGAVSVMQKERAFEDLYDAIRRATASPHEITGRISASSKSSEAAFNK